MRSLRDSRQLGWGDVAASSLVVVCGSAEEADLYVLLAFSGWSVWMGRVWFAVVNSVSS